MQLNPLPLLAALLLAIGLGAGGYGLYNWGASSGRAEVRSLREAIAEANADAILKAQEATREARRIEDERRQQIDEARRLVESAEALRAADADEYRKRLRTLLARTCRGNKTDPGRVPETARGPVRPAPADGLLLDTLTGNLEEFARRADRVNDQFAICFSAVANQKKVWRRDP